MPQTKFVLKKSLELHLKPLVVINKIDRPNARPREVADLTFDLFCELNATDEQLDFPIVYASGKDGYARLELDDADTDMTPLLETMLRRVLPPVGGCRTAVSDAGHHARLRQLPRPDGHRPHLPRHDHAERADRARQARRPSRDGDA